MKTVTLNVSQISHPNDLQLRESLDTDHIHEMAESLKADGKLPPVKVVQEGSTYWLWDGHHTLAAHKEADVTAIEVQITQAGTRLDARWLACSANTSHGLKRSNETKRRQVEAALKLRPKASDREIARHCQVGPSLVGDVRKAHLSENTDAPAKREVTRGGTTYEQNTSNIGRKPSPEPSSISGLTNTEARTYSDEPAPEPEAEEPTGEGELDPDSIESAQEGLDRLSAKVRDAANTARAVFQVSGQEIKAPWLNRFSWTGAIGTLNQYLRMIEDLRPVGGTSESPVTNRDAKAQKAMDR